MVPTGIKVAARRLRSRWDRDREAGLSGLRVYARGMERGVGGDKGAASRQVYRERRCPSGKGVGRASTRKKQIKKNADYAEGAKKEKAGLFRSLLAVMSERRLVW